jgi:hypothetical protein
VASTALIASLVERAADLLAAAWLFAFCPPEVAANVTVRSVAVEGTAFRVTLSDGRVLRQD